MNEKLLNSVIKESDSILSKLAAPKHQIDESEDTIKAILAFLQDDLNLLLSDDD